ncbi:MAG: glycoside hydrolase family 38 C-terminal domain-containing protein [Prevotella sp.]
MDQKHLKTIMKYGKLFFSCLILTFALPTSGQQNYFVDGFHGGIYGHYPVEWYTQYLVDQLNVNPQWVIGMEIEPETWDTVQVRTPEAYRQLRPLMSSSRIDVTNPTYAQPYLYNINGESIIRQFQYGMRKLRLHFPGITFSTYSSEEPCFTSQLPQLLSQLGFSYLSLKNPNTCWGGYMANFGGQLVNLIGPDGTAITTVPRYACERLQPNSVWQTIAWANSPEYLKACRDAGIVNPVGMCYQDAGWKRGPWLGSDRKDTKYVTWTDYISQYTDTNRATTHHFTQEDVRPGLMWGSQVLQRIAREVRHTENTLLQAEKLAAMDLIEHGNKPRQTDLDEAWRRLMLSQHHDSWIVPYNGFSIKGSWAKAIQWWTSTADSLSYGIINQAATTNTDPRYITLYNTTGQPRREVVITGRNNNLSVTQVSVPAFGHISIKKPEMAPITKRNLTGQTCTIENNLYRLTFDLNHGGTLKSLIDKQSGKDFIDTNNDNYHFGELRGYFPEIGGFSSSTASPVKASLTACGTLFTSLELQGIINGTLFTKTVTLQRDSKIIDCKLHIDWQNDVRIGENVKVVRNSSRTGFYDTRYKLNLLFPTNMKATQLSKDAPFDVCESRQDNNFFHDWNNMKHNVILHWTDVSDGNNGMALLTDHTTSYTFGKDYPLALTVQYSGPGLWWRNYPIDGPSEIHYALIPHQGRWDQAGIEQLAERWQQPILIQAGKTVDKSLMETSCRLSAVTTSNDGTISLRLFNANGDSKQSVRLHFPISRAELVDLDGNITETLQTKRGELTLTIPRFGIRTLRLTLKK